MALGYGSLYNHSDRPNARYHDEGGRTKVFTAIRDIGPGEEITVNYNGDPCDETPVGFEVVECLKVSKRRRSVPAGGSSPRMATAHGAQRAASCETCPARIASLAQDSNASRSTRISGGTSK